MYDVEHTGTKAAQQKHGAAVNFLLATLSRYSLQHSPEGMETHLTYDNKSKQLGVLVKQRLATNHKLQLKVSLCNDLDSWHRAPYSYLACTTINVWLVATSVVAPGFCPMSADCGSAEHCQRSPRVLCKISEVSWSPYSQSACSSSSAQRLLAIYGQTGAGALLGEGCYTSRKFNSHQTVLCYLLQSPY